MVILIPGRHHCLTDFQFKYLARLVVNGLLSEPDKYRNPIQISEKVTSIIFAATSANHSNTRRNPVPFHLRAMAILDFCQELMVPSFVFGIDDVGTLPDFASYTLKKIKHESEGKFDLNPENTIVACSSPVGKMYERLGFQILPMELRDHETGETLTHSPWDLVEMIAHSNVPWKENRDVFNHLHQSSFLIWNAYGIGEKVKKLFSDDMIGSDGDLTETRDYSSYVRQMDDIATLKYNETAPHIKPGRIGDIGCAVGTWIMLACKDERLRESDFIGIEVARQLYQICLQRKENKEFSNPYVFFAQKNAVTGLCFEPNSMNTIHASSLTHEIESYGGREDLLQFIQNRYEELAPGGVWINRDVVGPRERDKEVLLWMDDADGAKEDLPLDAANKDKIEAMSTMERFVLFAEQFRKGEGDGISFSWTTFGYKQYAKLTLSDAMEFISKKDYAGNWQSEMHEKFCFWSFDDWKSQLKAVGFDIEPSSHAYPNKWLIENRYQGKVALFEESAGILQPLPFPETHMLMVATRRV